MQYMDLICIQLFILILIPLMLFSFIRLMYFVLSTWWFFFLFSFFDLYEDFYSHLIDEFCFHPIVYHTDLLSLHWSLFIFYCYRDLVKWSWSTYQISKVMNFVWLNFIIVMKIHQLYLNIQINFDQLDFFSSQWWVFFTIKNGRWNLPIHCISKL